MQIKKYVGDNIQDTIFKVKADLGADAIILNTRKIKQGGFLGLFAQKKVEVMATLEEKKDNSTERKTLTEINKLKKIMGDLKLDYQKAINSQRKLPHEIKTVYDYLKKQGLKENINIKLIGEIRQQNEQSKKDVFQLLYKQLKQILGYCEPIRLNSRKKVILISGPTGAGKTTTIAKLAAIFSLKEKKKVGLITADTYRIAAIQQLQTYSEIVNIPLKVMYDKQELKKILINDFASYDLVLIDTAGSNWYDKIQLGYLQNICSNQLIDEVHLLVSMNTKSNDLEVIIKNFAELNPDKIILTKLDETTSYGDIINIKDKTKLPYSYITNGQNVPEDIEEANSERLLNYILGDFND